MTKSAWLTPDAAAGFTCRRLLIPSGRDWLAIVTGALNELIYAYNFEEYGDQTPDQTAAIFQVMFDQFCLDKDQECRLIGEIVFYAGTGTPNANWLLCNGASYLRSDYPNLFAVIGATYGAADGAHFNVPGASGRTLVAAGSGSGLTTRAAGDVFGEETHVLTIGELANHSHTDSGHTHSEVSAIATVGAAITGVPVPSAIPSVGVTGLGSANISASGSDSPHNNIQPSLAVPCWIVAL